MLGLFDLSFFLIAALVNLNSVPVVAAVGSGAILFWIIGFLFFFIPQGIAVLELSARYPQEGGIYNWNKTAFGDFHGFASGWCYWTNNIFYIPTLLFYIVGFMAFIGGEATAEVGRNPLLMGLISLALLWIITGVNILGFGVGKWVQTIGAFGTFLTASLILFIGVIALRTHGAANAISFSTMMPEWSDWRSMSLLSVVCLNFVGLELGSVIGDEIKNPLRNIPRAAIAAGIVTVALYVMSTFAILSTIPANEIGVIDGILQGVKRAAERVNLLWLVAPIAVLMSFNAAGNTSAWLAGSARIPFVIGLDRFLPSALGKIHPRYHTPYVALVVQGIASSFFIVVNAIGSTVHDMYLILLQSTIILQLIPYLYMFAALIRIRFYPEQFPSGPGYFQKSWLCYATGIVGFLSTFGGVVFALLPSNGVADTVNFEIKLLVGIGSFVIPALVLYRWNHRKRGVEGILPQTAEAATD